MQTEVQSSLCASLSIIYWLNEVYGGHRESQAQLGSKQSHAGILRKTREVTAGVEDEEIRAVYVSGPIHLHWEAFISTLREKRPCPLLCFLCFLKHKPLSGPNSPSCVLGVFAQDRGSGFECQPVHRQFKAQNRMQQFEFNVKFPCDYTKRFSCGKKNKQAVTSSSVSEGFIIDSIVFLPWSFLSGLRHCLISRWLMHL